MTCLLVKKVAENTEDICVLMCLKAPSGVYNWPLNFSGQNEAWPQR